LPGAGEGVEAGGGVEEIGDGATGILAALPIEECAGFPSGEILVGDGAASENGFEKELDGWERAELTGPGAGQPAVRKPGIGLGTALAREAGDGSAACH